MYLLERFLGDRYQRVNACIEELHGHLSGYINLIGSASYPFPEVCTANSLPFSTVRVEGLRHRRLYPGVGVIDRIEDLIETETRRLFGLDDSYMVFAQPHAATQANQAVFHAIRSGAPLKACGLALKDGGHISHLRGLPRGSKIAALPLGSKGLNSCGAVEVIRRERPDLIVLGASSFPHPLDPTPLRQAANDCGSWIHMDLAHMGLFIASGRHPPVFPAADSATIDLGKLFRGPRGAVLVARKTEASQVGSSLFPTVQSSPNQNSLFAKAVALIANDSDHVAAFADRLIKATARMAGKLQKEGLPLAFGGTSSHLLLIDLRPFGITGRECEERLEARRILANRNLIPDDDRSWDVASGIRISLTGPAILGYEDEDLDGLAAEIAGAAKGAPILGRVDNLLARYHQHLTALR